MRKYRGRGESLSVLVCIPHQCQDVLSASNALSNVCLYNKKSFFFLETLVVFSA